MEKAALLLAVASFISQGFLWRAVFKGRPSSTELPNKGEDPKPEPEKPLQREPGWSERMGPPVSPTNWAVSPPKGWVGRGPR